MKNNFPINNAEKLDARAEFAFYELAELAAIMCQTPIGFVSLDANRDEIGVDFQEFAFQLHSRLKPFRVTVIEDASRDKQLSKNRFVKNAPQIRFYAGVPLIDYSEKMLGSLCVIDYRARKLDSEQLDTLKIIARQIVSQFELRREAMQSEHLLQLNERIIEGLQSELDALETAEILKNETPAPSDTAKILRFSFSTEWSKKPKFAEMTAAKKREKTSRAVTQLLNSKRVLIAEPNSGVRRLLKQYSVIWGLESVETATGEETLKALRRAFESGKPFDLAVIDTSLPDREGFALTRQIRSDAALSKTQIILMTANGQRGDALLAAELGVAGYLTKPLQGAQIFDCLVAVLAQPAPEFAPNETSAPLLHAGDTNDREFAKENFNLYLSETEKHLDGIKNALEHEDTRAIEQMSSLICGNSFTVGAKKIAVIANRIAQTAKHGDLKKINPLLENFIEEFSQLQTELVEIGDGLISFGQPLNKI